MTRLVVMLNGLANAAAYIALAPIARLPGWLSATLVAAVTGVLMLLAFKFTSNQPAIKRIRRDIKANLLGMALFKEHIGICLRLQRRVFVGALRLLATAVVPVLAMIIPMSLLLGQLSAWYQARPLAVGEEAVVALKLRGAPGDPWPELALETDGAVELTLGPVRIESQRTACWNIRPRTTGYHRLVFHAGGERVDKDIAIGDGFMRTSPLRPSWNWTDAMLYPREPPLPADSSVHSIEIAYPTRAAWTCGSDHWVIYWFAASTVAALCCRRLFNVQL